MKITKFLLYILVALLLMSNGQLRLENKKFIGIEIRLPSLGYIDLIPKAIMGSKGALMVVKQVLNGLRFL